MSLWTNSANGLWRIATNWDANVPPDATFNFIFVTNTGTKTVTIDSATAAANLSLQRLILSAPSGSSNTLALVNLTTNQPLQLSSTLTLDLGGTMTLTNSALSPNTVTMDHGAALNLTNSLVRSIGSLSTFDVINGNVWLDSGLMDCSAIQSVRIGRTNNNVGTITVNGGTLLAPLLQLGTSFNARQGLLTVSGGTVNASGIVTAGYGVNATGVVAVTSGQFIATNDITYIGKSGFGQMSISGGTGTFAFLSVGNNADGSLSFSNGQLITKPRTTNDWFQIGNTGNGHFNMSGGTALLGGEFHVGDDSSGLGTGSGTALVTGGQIIATNDTTAIGRYGPGQLTITNATASLTNVSIGRHDGSTGTLTVQSNAQVFTLDALSIARFSNSVGHVFVNGGLISLTNDVVWVGREGVGDMTVSSGTVRAAASFVAVSTVVTDAVTLAVVTNMPSGTLTLAGGSMILTSNLLVGSSSFSTGQVFVTGGNLSITNSGNSGYLSVANGSLTLNQGNVTTDNLILTNNSGQFLLNGGTLQAKAAVVSNGAPFVVGDGIHPATFQLLGGTYSFANGLVISNNATVTGCGTIIGPISNFGTLSTNCAGTTVTITRATRSGTTATIFFTTLNGSNHVLEFKNALPDATWTPILPGVIGNGGVTNVQDTNAIVPNRFYHIHVQ